MARRRRRRAEATATAACYDARAESRGGSRRGLQVHHNLVKRAIIREALIVFGLDRVSCFVLDVGCGRGGDWSKFRDALEDLQREVVCDVCSILSWVGSDPSPRSIQVARSRHSREVGSRLCSPPSFSLGTAAESLRPSRVRPGSLGVLSAQFMLHYACDTRARCQELLRAAAEALVGGGVLVATLVHSRRLVREVRRESASSPYRPVGPEWAAGLEEASWGQQYSVTIRGRGGQVLVDGCLECAVPWQPLLSEAMRAGFNVHTAECLDDWVERRIQAEPVRGGELRRSRAELRTAEARLSATYAVLILVRAHGPGARPEAPRGGAGAERKRGPRGPEGHSDL